MIKKILGVILLALVLMTSMCAFAEPEAVPATEVPTTEAAPAEEVPAEEVPQAPAEPQEQAYVTIKQQLEQMGALNNKKDHKLEIKSVSYNGKDKLTVAIENKSDINFEGNFVLEGDEKTKVAFTSDNTNVKGKPVKTEDRLRMFNFTIPAKETVIFEEEIVSESKKPGLNLCVQYVEYGTQPMSADDIYTIYKEDILKDAKTSGGSFGVVMGKIGGYLLDNILSVISLIISLIALLFALLGNKKKNDKEIPSEETISDDIVENVIASNYPSEPACEDADASEEAVEEEKETEE